MNEFEHQVIDKVMGAIHDLELKLVEEIGDVRGEIKAVNAEYTNLITILKANIDQDTKRLDKHSAEIDDCNTRLAAVEEWKAQFEKLSQNIEGWAQRLAAQEEWKAQFEKSVANRIAISNPITTIVAIVLAFFLNKFF